MAEGLQIDPAGYTNLVTNPSFEVALTGWASDFGPVQVGTTRTRDTTQFYSGAASLKAVCDGTHTNQGAGLALPGPLVAGTTYTFSAYVKGNAGGEQVVLLGEDFNTGAGGSANTPITLTTSWQRVTGTWTVTITSSNPGIFVLHSAASAATFFVDAVQVTQTATAVTYFDGDTAGSSWTGVAGASTSVTEGFDNVPFDLVDGTATFLLEAAYPTPDRDSMWAPSADTEGDPLIQHRYKNRQITIKIRVIGASASALQTTLGYLEQKIGKINRECGTLKRTAPSGSTVVFDVVGATSDIPIDWRHLNFNRVEVTIVFDAKPFGRGTPVKGSAHAETTLPVLVFTETAIGGDVPALGKLVVTEAQAVDQWWLTWGVQSRYYDSAATANLYYEAEALTPLGTSATAAGPTGASGAGNNTILSGALTTANQAILSTQATGGGAHLTHVGDFKVYARVQTPIANTGVVSLALEWAVGDYRRVTTNTPVVFPAVSYNATWRLVDLGTVSIPKALTGTQRWEARPLAKSTHVGDTIYVDWLMLMPIAEGSGRASAVVSSPAPSALLARDEFAQTAGALAGKTMPVGGTWTKLAPAGASTDFAVTGSGTTTRTTVSDTAQQIDGTTGLAAATVAVQADMSSSTFGSSCVTGVALRVSSATRYLLVFVQPSGQYTANIVVQATNGGTQVTYYTQSVAWAVNITNTLRAAIDASNRIYVWWNGTLTVTCVGDATLASTGDVGISDTNLAGTAATRTFDNFLVYVPTSDAAIFASEQAQIRNDGVIRQDSTASYWQPVSKYEGDYLLVPPAGREARTARFIVKASRNDLTTGADTGIDDISATLTYTPRYLVIPEA